ncbi:MAG TPA: hypothetical protein V6C50_11430 [Crinalium sp.]
MMAIDQPHKLTRHFGQAVDRLSLRLQFVGSWAIVSLTTAAVGQAQQVVPLPPPPTVSVPALTNAPLSTNSTATPGGETVFLAPINRPSASGQYTV